MSRRRPPRLASSRLMQRHLTAAEVGADPDSDEDFLPPVPWRRLRSSAGESSGTGTDTVPSTSGRVSRAVQRGLNAIRSGTSSQPAELGDRFPFLNRGRGKRAGFKENRKKKQGKRLTWKTIPCCLSGPHMTKVPARDMMDGLCREGLGTLWFSKEQELEHLDPQEFHFLILCLYPFLKNVPYEICRAGGPGHQVLVALHINDSDKIPKKEQPFIPFFDVGQLKELIGRKGCLYIRPLTTIKGYARMSEVEVMYIRASIRRHTLLKEPSGVISVMRRF